MHAQHFFDQVLCQIEAGAPEVALPLLAGQMFAARLDEERWASTRDIYRAHPLHRTMLEDPYVARCFEKPRGYAGDAALIDLIYDRSPPSGTQMRGRRLFSVTTNFPTAEAVRLRRAFAADLVTSAHEKQKRILSLACGHFREGEVLIGKPIQNVVLVDQDSLALEVVRQRFGATIRCRHANVFNYLRGAIAACENFDLIYTLGLTDYLDDRAMTLLHRMVRRILAPGGKFVLANFVPHNLAAGWLDAVMDWHLIYRQEEELRGFAEAAGFSAKTWMDQTGSVAWCEMTLRETTACPSASQE